MAKTAGKPVPRKPAGRPSRKPTVRHSGQQTARTQYNKPPSTTNYGTRPSVMPGQPGVPTGVRPPTAARPPSVMPGQPGVPTGRPVKTTAAPITRPAPNAVNRAAALAANIAKTAANQQQHRAVARTAMNHPTEVASGPGGGNTGGGGFSGGGGGGGVTPIAPTPQVTTPTTPVTSRPTPAVTSPSTPGAPSNVGSFTSRGRNMTAGRFNRQRLNRGPRTGMSVTPEMLQRIAAQRIGPT